ncbi:MAG: NAD+ synthase [Candidatus Nanohaloarchaea archaeon]|nr:NAD+ synthase [Candidatus Nanohaloarchaea archaeon]
MVDITSAAGEITDFLEEYLDRSGAEGYVLGVSGGLDSAVTLQLAVDAVGSDRVTGLVMPGQPSRAENVADARELCETLGVTAHEIGIEPVVEAFSGAAPFDPGREAAGNLRVRARMVLTYMVANQEDLLVCGSSNKSEVMLGYFTKHGDGAADVKPLADLYKTEVRELAEHLDLPETFVEKQPTAGMWAGQTDEDELGYTYETIDAVLVPLVEDGKSVDAVAEETGIDRDAVETIAAMHEDSSHKREPAPAPGLR